MKAAKVLYKSAKAGIIGSSDVEIMVHFPPTRGLCSQTPAATHPFRTGCPERTPLTTSAGGPVLLRRGGKPRAACGTSCSPGRATLLPRQILRRLALPARPVSSLTRVVCVCCACATWHSSGSALVIR